MSAYDDHEADYFRRLDRDTAALLGDRGVTARERQAYERGFRDGVSAQPERSLYAPVAVPWRRVRAQDVIRGDDGELYSVIRSGWVAGPDNRRTHWGLTLTCGDYRAPVTGDPDDRASVLVGLDLLAAVTLTGEQLGAALIATRTDPDGGHTGDLPWRVGS